MGQANILEILNEHHTEWLTPRDVKHKVDNMNSINCINVKNISLALRKLYKAKFIEQKIVFEQLKSTGRRYWIRYYKAN